MSYIFNFNDATAYDKWFDKPLNKFVFELERQLMIKMLKPMPGSSVIDIGCGTGANLIPFIEMGVQATGIDPSRYMLDIALQKVKLRAELHLGFAEYLPFDDNSFNYACFFTTLEFVENPEKAIREACRVAKDKIFIGVLNRYAPQAVFMRLKGIFTQSIYNHARFFSIWQLKRIIRSILGDVPISWETTYHFPMAHGSIVSMIERSCIVKKCPFGTFVGMVVTLVPRFKTTPLSLVCRTKATAQTATG